MTRALLIGAEPPCPLGYAYVTENYEAIVIGSLSLGQLHDFLSNKIQQKYHHDSFYDVALRD